MRKSIISGLCLILGTLVFAISQEAMIPETVIVNQVDENGLPHGPWHLCIPGYIGDCSQYFLHNYCWYEHNTPRVSVCWTSDENACYPPITLTTFKLYKHLKDTNYLAYHYESELPLEKYLSQIAPEQKEYFCNLNAPVYLELPNSLPADFYDYSLHIPSHTICEFMRQNVSEAQELTPFLFWDDTLHGNYVLTDKSGAALDTLHF